MDSSCEDLRFRYSLFASSTSTKSSNSCFFTISSSPPFFPFFDDLGALASVFWRVAAFGKMNSSVKTGHVHLTYYKPDIISEQAGLCKIIVVKAMCANRTKCYILGSGQCEL